MPRVNPEVFCFYELIARRSSLTARASRLAPRASPLKELLVDLYLDSHVARADFFAERSGEPVGSALVRVVEADFHGGVETLDFGLDDVFIQFVGRDAIT